MVIKETYNEFFGGRLYPKVNVMMNEELTNQLAMQIISRTANGGLRMYLGLEDESGHDSAVEVIIDGDELKAIAELIKSQLI